MRLHAVIAGFALSFVLCTLSACSSTAPGADPSQTSGVGPGTASRPAQPFVPSDEVGAKPPSPAEVAAAMNIVNTELFAGTSRAMKTAADSAGVGFSETVADGDPAKNIEQLNALLNKGVGAVLVWDIDVEAQRPVVKALMDSGAAAFTTSSGPSTMPMVANQVDMGTTMGKAISEHIATEMNGEAKVAIFNLDRLPNIKPRFDALRESLLATGPGVEIVSDVSWDAADADFGFKTMNTILQAHPDVDVVIGEDPVVVSALAAVEAKGVDSSGMAFFGAGGAPEALAKIKEGGPYKGSFAFNFSVLGYAAGVWGGDWIAGRQIPALTLIKAVPLQSVTDIEAYEADVADPSATFETKLDTYLETLGNISYETRTEYWNSTNPQ